MKVVTGHLTSSDKKAITAIMSMQLSSGKVGKKTYHITKDENIYTVSYQVKDRGLIPCVGSPLRISTYVSKFTL